MLRFASVRARWPGALSCLPILLFCLAAQPSAAFDRTNVPLKNWGGFSVNRSWVYDALEKIVLAGLADQALLNTKPLSRVEAARVVAQAVRRLEWDKYGDYNHRGYLEEILYQLVEEFGPELGEMGVRTPLNRDATSDFFGLKPIDHAQFRMDFASRSQKVSDSFGKRVRKGANFGSTLDGRIQVGDFFSLYYQPEFLSDKDISHGRLQSGYGKLTLWNTELAVGRESLWWGPGFRGSMLFSNNAFPLDQVRLSSAEPFRLPWLLSYLGPIKLLMMAGQLDEHREVPNAKVGGLRISAAPYHSLEVGFGRAFQFGGKGRDINPGQFLKIQAFNQGSDRSDSPLNVNNVLSVDATLRLADAERYFLITRDMALYGELGWDDTTKGFFAPDRPGYIIGIYMAGFGGDPKLDLRIEYAQTSIRSFTHDTIYFGGFTHRGRVLSHFIGTKGNDLYARLARWISPDLMIGLQASQSEIGSTDFPSTLTLPREKRTSFGFDLSYRISDRSAIFLGTDFAKIKDRGFVSGKSGNDHLFRFEFTRSFGQ